MENESYNPSLLADNHRDFWLKTVARRCNDFHGRFTALINQTAKEFKQEMNDTLKVIDSASSCEVERQAIRAVVEPIMLDMYKAFYAAIVGNSEAAAPTVPARHQPDATTPVRESLSTQDPQATTVRVFLVLLYCYY